VTKDAKNRRLLSRSAYIAICASFAIGFGWATVKSQESTAACPENLSAQPTAPENNERDLLLKEADACLHTGKPIQAIDVFGELIRNDPKDAFSYMNRGTVRIVLGDAEKGMADLTTAIGLKPDLMEAWYNRGNALLLNLQRYDDAISDLNEAISLKPDFAPAYCSRGLAKLKLGRYDDALADYDSGISRDPKQNYCHSNRGDLYLHTGQYQKAIDDLSMALSGRPPSDATILSMRGQAFEALGEKDQAIRDYRAALAINSSLESARKGVERLNQN
jgi:tetratricopeptide (TPR) repeat protein